MCVGRVSTVTLLALGVSLPFVPILKHGIGCVLEVESGGKHRTAVGCDCVDVLKHTRLIVLFTTRQLLQRVIAWRLPTTSRCCPSCVAPGWLVMCCFRFWRSSVHTCPAYMQAFDSICFQYQYGALVASGQ